MKNIFLLVLLSATLVVTGQNPNNVTYSPVPLPAGANYGSSTTQDHYMVGYNPETQTEFIVGSTNDEELGKSLYSDPYIPPDAEISEEIIGQKVFTAPIQVSNPTTYPWRAFVKLYTTFPNTPANEVHEGSGVLIGSKYVLTAGHCVYNSAEGGWAKTIRVIPAYDNGSEPYGNAKMIMPCSWTPWINDNNLQWDMGIIRLDREIGTQTGWLGFSSRDDTFLSTKTFQNMSYPGEYPYDGQKMYYQYGTYDEVTENILYYNPKSYGGQSGSGTYYKNENGDRYVAAVHSHSNDNNQSGQTRVTTSRFNSIYNFVHDPAGIENNQTDYLKNFQLYPNPAVDKINIRYNTAKNGTTISIYSLLGVIVFHQSNQSNQDEITVPIDKLSPGYYLVSVSDGKSTATKSFIKAGNN